MGQNEADRVAQAKAEEHRKQEKDRIRQQEEQGRANRRSLIQQLEVEIPQTLRILKERGYPQIELVYVKDRSLVGFLLFGRTIRKGGWKIGMFTREHAMEVKNIAPIYLLSDGTILAYEYQSEPTKDSTHFIGKSRFPSEINEIDILEAALQGVLALRNLA